MWLFLERFSTFTHESNRAFLCSECLHRLSREYNNSVANSKNVSERRRKFFLSHRTNQFYVKLNWPKWPEHSTKFLWLSSNQMIDLKMLNGSEIHLMWKMEAKVTLINLWTGAHKWTKKKINKIESSIGLSLGAKANGFVYVVGCRVHIRQAAAYLMVCVKCRDIGKKRHSTALNDESF